MSARTRPILVVLLIALVSIAVVLKFDFSEELGVSKEALGKGEYSRCATFMFAHLGEMHLFSNLLGLALVGVLAQELRLRGSTFLAVFFFAGFVTVALVLPAVAETYVFMGASVGICGLFGVVAIEVKRYGFSPIPVFALFALALLLRPAIWLLHGEAIASAEVTLQTLMHLLALSLGAALAIGYRKIIREKRGKKLLRR